VFAYAMRDLLAKSPRYREATPQDGSNVFRISVVAEVDQTDYRDPLTPITVALSVVFLRHGDFLGHIVQSCGSAKLEACAQEALTALDSLANDQ
jgi:hypothetical protein